MTTACDVPCCWKHEQLEVAEGATVGAWVLLEVGQQEGVRASGRALTPNVRKADLSA